MTEGGTVIASYTYDALNRRIGVDDNGTKTWTVYDGTNPYADFTGSGTLEERYLYGPGVVDGAVVDQLLARTSSGGATAWYMTDKLGSVRDIVNATSGADLDHIVYDSFGNILTETNATNGDRFKFAGMEYDSVTGQYYDRARDYDSAIGRFMAQDPSGFGAGDVDLYRYVNDSPTNGTDPTGLQGPFSNTMMTNWEASHQKTQAELDALIEDALAVQQQVIMARRVAVAKVIAAQSAANAALAARKRSGKESSSENYEQANYEQQLRGRAEIIQNARNQVAMMQATRDEAQDQLAAARNGAVPSLQALMRTKIQAVDNDKEHIDRILQMNPLSKVDDGGEPDAVTEAVQAKAAKATQAAGNMQEALQAQIQQENMRAAEKKKTNASPTP